jgi:hypothetical protein
MRLKPALLLSAVVAIVLAGPRAVSGEVNCEQVRLYVSTGRTIEEVADTMIIDIEEAKKCLEGQAKPAGTPAAPKEK